MTRSKYIIYNEGYEPGEGSGIPIIFPEVVSHIKMATDLGVRDRILGAGFVNIQTLKTSGDSTSLGKKSRGAEDDRIMNLYFGPEE